MQTFMQSIVMHIAAPHGYSIAMYLFCLLLNTCKYFHVLYCNETEEHEL